MAQMKGARNAVLAAMFAALACVAAAQSQGELKHICTSPHRSCDRKKMHCLPCFLLQANSYLLSLLSLPRVILSRDASAMLNRHMGLRRDYESGIYGRNRGFEAGGGAATSVQGGDLQFVAPHGSMHHKSFTDRRKCALFSIVRVYPDNGTHICVSILYYLDLRL
jgi:hypothetical protein